ncbi:hypothetical protein KC19_6G087400 [Ceratodon purpureus]|uniref:TF-B3 domain-containing protein n=1 Tax=Ceratodon purpureus TaxID=3225 RepID=A0A8T0HIH7_CERPU|nr:hypothetical protein KC19_6G087200 [Ceratodon purpureus]KAG0569391.1 hypothetical protein KC19_6G087300 [Ceratodon purpureus]KAG0569392.1 hypothetical protein KC19_6G087400 [Ceratodon purpureus]
MSRVVLDEAIDMEAPLITEGMRRDRARAEESVGRRSIVDVDRSEGRLISEILEAGKARRAGIRVNKGTVVWQGRNVFQKTLTAGAVSKAYQLTLPTGFLHHYADRIREHIVLRSVTERKTWTLKVNVYFPDGRPQFILGGRAYKEFAVANGLVPGDRLTFTLEGMSKFEVLIVRRSVENLNAVPSAVQQTVQSSPLSSTYTKSLAQQQAHLAAQCSVKMERESS